MKQFYLRLLAVALALMFSLSIGFGRASPIHVVYGASLEAFQEGSRWGFRDSAGNIIIPAIYDRVRPFAVGVAAVMMLDSTYGVSGQENWGIINISGHVVVPLVYTERDINVLLAVIRLPIGSVPDVVESLHWSQLRPLIPLRVPFRILDLGTGISYYVISMSNGNHADVETVTAHDTTLLFESFGGQQTWNGRPIWVFIGDRVFSASIHSMPHAGATISDNNMDGHVCLHFYGSTTHNTNLPTYHDVIMNAQRHFYLYHQWISQGHGGTWNVPVPMPEPEPTLAPEPTHIPEPTPFPTPEPTLEPTIIPIPTPPPQIQSTPPQIQSTERVMAMPTQAAVVIDGVEVAFQAFHINGNNYFRLRDLAYALNGSEAQFNLGWDAENYAIFIRSGQAYLPIGGELSIADTGPTMATSTQANIFLNGERFNPRAFHIDGSNYFMLAELADALGFWVAWDSVNRIIFVSTFVYF